MTPNNAFNALRGVLGLFGGTNKVKKTDEDDGTEAPDVSSEFESKMSDSEIIRLSKEWQQADFIASKKIKEEQKQNLAYWKGEQGTMMTMANKRELIDNLIFEAVETFLPIATRANPEPNVADTSGEQDDVTKSLRNALEYQAQRQFLRMKLKRITRNWVIYLIGVAKIGWNPELNDIETTAVLPSRLILDPTAVIDEGGVYCGEYIGERKKKSAGKLMKMFPKSAQKIMELATQRKGQKLQYIEWWTSTDVFFTLEDIVLGKFRNPHWNYSGKTIVTDAVTGEQIEEEIEGFNHLAQPPIPYVFLSIFNVGRGPYDETSLINQNIPLQDTINKRYQQIDRNVDGQNNGIVLSGKHFTKEQSSEAAVQLAKGNPLWVPDGNIGDSYVRDNPPALSPNVFEHLQDAREELRNIFGTSGSQPQAQDGTDTARGKILINQMDSSRIGGGITEYIEAMCGTIFNMWTQMMYVYYTEERAIPVLGAKQGEQFLKIRNTDLHRVFFITVKEGSLVPKDPMTQRNEAVDLWNAGALDPITLFTRLDFPNPQESAKDLLMWLMIKEGKLPPQMMFPDFQSPQLPVGQPGQPGAEAPPEQAQDMGQQLIGQVPLQ